MAISKTGGGARKVMDVQAGAIVVVTTGEYSDYKVVRLMKALVRFDAKEVEARFKQTDGYQPDQDRWGDEAGNQERFVAYMLSEGIVATATDHDVVIMKIGSWSNDLHVEAEGAGKEEIWSM